MLDYLIDPAYSSFIIVHAASFKQRGSLWPFKCTCSCSCSSSSSRWRCCGVFAGSLSRLPISKHGLCALRTIAPPVDSPPLPVRPWCEVKSRRGAPKRVNTEGFACPNRRCLYCGITDAHIHALVGDGKHGQTEHIQTFRCQACHTTFSARHDTPFYRLKTPSHQVARVLSALAEGLDPSEASRVFGSRQATITTWLTREGSHAQILHERSFCHLWLPHLQLDELRTRLRSSKQVLWMWLAIDPLTRD